MIATHSLWVTESGLLPIREFERQRLLALFSSVA